MPLDPRVILAQERMKHKNKVFCLGCAGAFAMTVPYCSDCNNRLTPDMRPTPGAKIPIKQIVTNAIHITVQRTQEQDKARRRAYSASGDRITPKKVCPVCHIYQKYGVLCKRHWDMLPIEHRPISNQDMSKWEFREMMTWFSEQGETRPIPEGRLDKHKRNDV